MRYCIFCGVEIPSDAKFCQVCGKEQPEADSLHKTEKSPADEGMADAEQEKQTIMGKLLNSPTKMIIAGIGGFLVLISIITAVITLMLKK